MISRLHQVCQGRKALTCWGFLCAIPVKGQKCLSPKERAMHKSSTADKFSVWRALMPGSRNWGQSRGDQKTRTRARPLQVSLYSQGKSGEKGQVALREQVSPHWARNNCWASTMGAKVRLKDFRCLCPLPSLLEEAREA